MEEAEANTLWLMITTVSHSLCVSVLGGFYDFVIFNSDLSQLLF